MKKRIFAILMALIMVVSLVAGAVPALAAEASITLKLHYHREDGNYEGWEMWFWDPDATSELEPPYQFEDENGEMVATINLVPGTMQVGFIVRLGEWEAKDIEADQFIDITGILEGTVHYYVESGKEGGELVEGDDVVRGVVIASNRYDPKGNSGNGNKPMITVKMSSEMDYEPTVDTFAVYNSDSKIKVEGVKKVAQYYYLTLAEELDLSRGYTISFEEREYAVTMPDYYSNPDFEALYTYTGDDLGATYTKEKTSLRVWAPTAVDVAVNLYTNGDPAAQKDPVETVPMTKDVNGTWVATLDGDRNGTYYTYLVTLDNDVNEACDPYARTTGVNGKRAMIIDLASTNPEGWDADKNPHAGENFTDAVIYELHVRDLSSDSSSGIKNVGKYLGIIEAGTKNSNGIATGLDHMLDLGITHLHLLPSYDYGSVDESKLDTEPGQFNWGYDPVNYNVPEGSYSTDPFNGEVRVKEFKQMVKGLHDAGISVIMDVVYNHVYDTNRFCVNQIVPGYFSRPGSNGSGCGNDTASERSMVSKYIVDSVTYWANEYHIDGFRFDLVGLIDTDTINALMESVKKDNPDVVFYGEGWTMGTSVTKTGMTLCTQTNSTKVPGFAFFSDTVRNLIKGGTYGGVSAGFISGGNAAPADLNSCFKGMPQWCTTPSQSINYISCHDNNTLYDHIMLVTPNATEAERISMNKLGAAFVITAQGIPFFQAGEEFLRSKPDGEGGYNENSYNASDDVNSMKWDDLNKAEYMDVYEYYKGLIAFRKAHPALRLTDSATVESSVVPVSGLPSKVAAYEIAGGVNGETAEALFAAFNANNSEQTVNLPEGEWTICINGEDAGTTALGTATGSVKIAPLSAVVLVKGEVGGDPAPTTPSDPAPTTPGGSEEVIPDNTGLIIAVIVAAVALVALIVVAVFLKKGKKK